MRDRRFVTDHRGGPLKKEQHRQLIQWACLCTQHVLPLIEENPDERLDTALFVAAEWSAGKVSVGAARKAALGVIALANESSDPVRIAVARSAGHAVATAHMSDHSLGAALYALKAVNKAGKNADTERQWQNNQLPYEIRELVLTSRIKKEKHFKI